MDCDKALTATKRWIRALCARLCAAAYRPSLRPNTDPLTALTPAVSGSVFGLWTNRLLSTARVARGGSPLCDLIFALCFTPNYAEVLVQVVFNASSRMSPHDGWESEAVIPASRHAVLDMQSHRTPQANPATQRLAWRCGRRSRMLFIIRRVTI